jgi:EAL domain-containing protein (putative c-di-GMP-specific phosphodiesterase class I)
MDNIHTMVSKLQTLCEYGVLISIDDFGTGYSSLAYIARLPIHALKIDRSFTSEMTRDANSPTIVKSVISLAHSLNLKVVAEGVDTAEQFRMLAELRCDEVQRYYFGRPLAASDIVQVRKSAAV